MEKLYNEIIIILFIILFIRITISLNICEVIK